MLGGNFDQRNNFRSSNNCRFDNDKFIIDVACCGLVMSSLVPLSKETKKHFR
jgi:hypothetical protein